MGLHHLLVFKFPENRLFGSAIFLSSWLNLLIPLAAKLDPKAVIVVRGMQGLVGGVTCPACHGILQWWAPRWRGPEWPPLPSAGPTVALR